MISSKAPYIRTDYIADRQRQDRSYRDIERSQPVESWGSGILQCAGFVGLCILAWIIAANISQYLVGG